MLEQGAEFARVLEHRSPLGSSMLVCNTIKSNADKALSWRNQTNPNPSNIWTPSESNNPIRLIADLRPTDFFGQSFCLL